MYTITQLIQMLNQEVAWCEECDEDLEVTGYKPMRIEPLLHDIEERLRGLTKLIRDTPGINTLNVIRKAEIRMLQELRSCVEDAEQDMLTLSEPTE